MVKFKEYFVGFLKKFDNAQQKVTTKDVEEFTRGLANLRNSSENDCEWNFVRMYKLLFNRDYNKLLLCIKI